MKLKLFPFLLAPIATLVIFAGEATMTSSPVLAQPTQGQRQVKEAGINMTAIVVTLLILAGCFGIVMLVLSSQRKARELQQRSQQPQYNQSRTGDSTYGGPMGYNYPNQSNMGNGAGINGYNTSGGQYNQGGTDLYSNDNWSGQDAEVREESGGGQYNQSGTDLYSNDNGSGQDAEVQEESGVGQYNQGGTDLYSNDNGSGQDAEVQESGGSDSGSDYSVSE